MTGKKGNATISATQHMVDTHSHVPDRSEVFIFKGKLMRALKLVALSTIIAASTTFGTQAHSEGSPTSSRVSAESFAKDAFKTLYTLPRTPETMRAIPALLHDEKAWQMFLQHNFAAPNIGLATLKDLTATYNFADVKTDAKVLKNSVSVSLAAIQEVRVFGRLAGTNCVATTLFLDMPKGIEDATGATIKEVLMITTPMEDICEPIGSK
jgi:hypothetical protein